MNPRRWPQALSTMAIVATGLAAGADAAATLDPSASALTSPGFVVGPKLHDGQAEYIDSLGQLVRTGWCQTVELDGSLTNAPMTTPGVPSLAPGPPGTWPLLAALEGQTITVYYADCTPSPQATGSYDMTSVAPPGTSWPNTIDLASFSDGSVVYPGARTEGETLYLLDPATQEASVLLSAATLTTIGVGESWRYKRLETAANDRIWAVVMRVLNTKHYAVVSIGRDGSLEVALGPLAHSDGTLVDAEYADLRYWSALDAMVLTPTTPPWLGRPTMAVFPLDQPDLTQVPRPAWPAFDEVMHAVDEGITRAGIGGYGGTTASATGELFVRYGTGMRQLTLDPTVADWDHDLLTRAEEDAAGLSDLDADADDDGLVDGDDPDPLVHDGAVGPPPLLGWSTDIEDWAWLRDFKGLGWVASPAGGLLCMHRGDPTAKTWECRDTLDRVHATEVLHPAPAPDGSIFWYDPPTAWIQRWDPSSETSTPFADLGDAGQPAGLRAVSGDAVVAHWWGSPMAPLTLYRGDGSTWQVSAPSGTDRAQCPFAASEEDLASCDDPTHPIYGRLIPATAKDFQPVVTWSFSGYDLAREQLLITLLPGTPWRMVVGLGADGPLAFRLDAADFPSAQRDAEPSFMPHPSGSWFVSASAVHDRSLRMVRDRAAVSPVGEWFRDGFLSVDASSITWSELIPVLPDPTPGEVIFWSGMDGWQLQRLTQSGAVVGWLDAAAFAGHLDDTAAAAVEAAPLGEVDHLGVDLTGKRLCMVEGDGTRLWEISLTAEGAVAAIDLLGTGDTQACAYDEDGALATASKTELVLPDRTISLLAQGFSAISTLQRVDGAWLLGDRGRAARCYLDGSDEPLDRTFQVAEIGRPVSDVVVWAEPFSRIMTMRADTVCGHDGEPVELLVPAPEELRAKQALAVRADGTVFWGAGSELWTRVRPYYPADLGPQTASWPHKESSDQEPLVTWTGAGIANGAAVALPGGDFPPPYATLGADTGSDPDPSGDQPGGTDGGDGSPDGAGDPTGGGGESSDDGAGDGSGDSQGGSGGDGGGGGCGASPSGGAPAGLAFLLLLALCHRRWRSLGFGLAAAALIVGAGGCDGSTAGGSSDGSGSASGSGSGSGGAIVYEGSAPEGGSGPENLEPLLPIRPGLRLDMGITTFAVTAVSADGTRASTTRGPMVKTPHGWAIEDVVVTNQNLIGAAGELVAYVDGAILVVPDTVRVGMTWTSGPWDYEVTAREEGVETPFGPRTVWDITVGNPGQVARYAEGIGYLTHGVLGGLNGGTVPLDDAVHPRPASPLLPLEPLFGGEPLPLGEGLQMNVIEAEDGLAVAVEHRSWHYDQFGVPPWELVISWSCMGVFGEGHVVDIHARDDAVNYGTQVIDYDAPIPRSCQLHGRPPPGNGFDNEHDPTDFWIGPNGDMFFTGGFFSGGPLGGFGEAGAFQPTTINIGKPGMWRLFSWLDRSRGAIEDEISIPAAAARAELILGHDLLGPTTRPNALVKPDVTGTALSMAWLEADGRLSYSVFDLTVPEFRAPAVGRAVIGLRTPAVRPGARDLLYFDPEEGVLDELVLEDEGYRLERVASFELPAHHRLVGAARMGETSPGHVLVVTSLIAPAREFALAPDARETYFWQLELPDGSGPDVAPPAGLAVLARHTGHDAIVCWPPSSEPLQTDGWSLGGVPARGVFPLESEPTCALVLRDLATWRSEAAWLEGPIPGVGPARVTLHGEMPPRVGRGVISQGVFDAPVVTTNGLIVDGHTVDAWGIPKLARELYGHPDQVGDASGNGAWLWVRESYFEPSGRAGKDWLSFFLGADGVMTQTQLEAHAANPIEPAMGPPLLDGGILTEGAVLHLDGSYDVIDLPSLYPGGHVRLLDGTWCTQGTLSVRCQLPDGTVVEYEPDWGPNTFMYGLHPLPSGLLFVALSQGSGLLDPATGETWIYDTPTLRDVEVHPGPRLVASDQEHERWEITDAGPVKATRPDLPADAAGVRDHFITETTELLVTKDGDLFRFPR